MQGCCCSEAMALLCVWTKCLGLDGHTVFGRCLVICRPLWCWHVLTFLAELAYLLRFIGSCGIFAAANPSMTGFKQEELPLDAESWISKLAIDHDDNHSNYTHEHFVATLLLAMDILGPRHWTVKWMAGLLLENAYAKCSKRIAGCGKSLLVLIKYLMQWAKDVDPIEECTVDFVGCILQCVKALLALDWEREATALASRGFNFYRGVWGDRDADTLFLLKISTKMRVSQSFLDDFSWGTIQEELTHACITNAAGGRDDGRISKCRKDLHRALTKKADPRATSHLGFWFCGPRRPPKLRRLSRSKIRHFACTTLHHMSHPETIVDHLREGFLPEYPRIQSVCPLYQQYPCQSHQSVRPSILQFSPVPLCLLGWRGLPPALRWRLHLPPKNSPGCWEEMPSSSWKSNQMGFIFQSMSRSGYIRVTTLTKCNVHLSHFKYLHKISGGLWML